LFPLDSTVFHPDGNSQGNTMEKSLSNRDLAWRLLRSSVEKKDRDCGDNAQRDEDEERDPHANRNTAGKRVTTGRDSHESREPFVEFHGF
jgi:hypothetical protein